MMTPCGVNEIYDRAKHVCGAKLERNMHKGARRVRH